MAHAKDIAWCPGCGNFPIRAALEGALKELALPTEKVVLTSGIGQGAKMPHYLDAHFFNGLHGRSVPLAAGIKIVRPDLTVIAVSGDGCMYGEGGNHFVHAIRKNLDITILTTDNQIFALTKGQSSPTTDAGVRNAFDPQGNPHRPLNPLSLAIALGAPFVARCFAREKDHLKETIKEAVRFKGTALIDILQPCVSFNKINTYQWYGERVFKVSSPAADRFEAMKTAELWGDRIAIGIIYRNDGAEVREGADVFRRPVSRESMEQLLQEVHA
ncbi:MAG TPA: thiamine pyrophosphate-dependent enzyme [Syntrophales bacterium]|nr:thiamine pyrophosphate-dependent enzyme [Syntrophales bacterium]HRT70768.1 thiamine pyrophosphate-dependent enzyme [Syntrophales bacterium]